MDLRPYQLNAINKLREAFAQGHKRVILCAPTGAGKTVMFSAIAQGAMQKGKRVMILTDRGELLWQAGGALNNLAIVPELITSETTRLNLSQRIFVAMIETLYRRREQRDYKMLLESVDLFIFDECHKRTFDKLLPYLPDSALVLGATATPWREGKGNTMMDIYSKLVEATKIKELIEQEYLAYPTYYAVDVDLSKIKTKGGDFDPDSMGEEYTKLKVYEGVIENYILHAEGSKAIVFAPNLASANVILNELKAHDFPAMLLDGSATREERRNGLKWYKETPGAFMVNVGLFTTGFDEPSIETVILYRATKSLPLFLQMIGRGSRTTETKKDFKVLDFGNNLKRFGLWDFDRDWTKPPKKYKDGVAPVKECPKCMAFLPIKATECNYCGYAFEKKEPEIIEEFKMLKKIEVYRKAETGTVKDWALLTKAKRLHPNYVIRRCCKTWQQAIEYRDLMGYKKGWLYMVKDKTSHLVGSHNEF